MARTSRSKTNQLKNYTLLFKKYWLLILVVMLATWLRTYDLGERAIFFGDAGRDLLEAASAVEENRLPLLGIPSSVPRFHQGPLTVWLAMFLYPLFGYHLWGYSLVFALLSVMAVIGVYELLATQLPEKEHPHQFIYQVSLIATVLVAFSPLAIAHARMPYHTTPIPLVTIVFLWALMRLWQAQKYSWFTSTLAFSLLFQFELAVFPLILLIPYCIWRTRQKVSISKATQGMVGLLIGLLPQIVYDVTHGFRQVGGFLLWVGYRLGSFVAGDHAPGLSKITNFFTSVLKFGSRIGSVQLGLGLIFLLLVAGCTTYLLYRWRQRSLPPIIEITLLANLLLFGAYFVHGSPSEAYFPPFLIIWPIVVAYSLSLWTTALQSRRWLAIGLSLWALWSVVSVFRANFFVDHSSSFSYGPSTGEQRAMIDLIASHKVNSFHLQTTLPQGEFPAFFDNFRFIAHQYQLEETAEATQVYFFETPDSFLQQYPNVMRYSFKAYDLYRVL